MQNYTEFNFKIQPLEPWNEILMAELIEIGFDSFTEELEGILAYIPTDLVNEENFKNLEIFNNENVKISYTFQEMPNINWNEEWEKNFSPINVEDKVLIRAEFHEAKSCDGRNHYSTKNVFRNWPSSYHTFDDSANAGYGF